MKVFITFALILVAGLGVNFAQDQDSTVVAEGRIIDGATGQSVAARITYQSLPYGNRIGVITGDKYNFPMFDGERYSIVVEAKGFAQVKYMLDPAEAKDWKLVRDIELGEHATAKKDKHAVGHVMRLDNLIFEVGKSKINPDSYGELDLVVSMMSNNPTMIVQLEGHTDYLGDPKENLKLSQARVDAVKEYVTSKGIKRDRVKTKAFGGTNPLSRDNTPEAHRMNRRVELRILEN